MDIAYTINEVAIMTGLTTRTIRNYLKSGLIDGEKENGVWTFSNESFCSFLNHPTIKPSLKAKRNSAVYDFLLDDKKKVNKICSILDMRVDDTEANEISEFFCNEINSNALSEFLSFSFEKNGRNVRIILSGSDEIVMELLSKYYNS